MALVLPPAFFSAHPPLSALSRHGTERLPPRCCAGDPSSSSPARQWRRRRSAGRLQIQDGAEKRSAAAELEKQSSRRRLLVLLLSSGGSLALAQLIAVDNNCGAAAAAADVDIGPPVGTVDELQEKKAIEGQIIGDLFGFDGLGKTPEEYVLGKVVALAQAGEGAVLFLGVDGFELPLQLVVGPAEAMAVLTAVQERKSRRPVTHEAWGLSLAAVGWKVDRVVITGNEKDVFYSSVVLSNLSQLLSSPSGIKKSVDMRPSDGIALALRCRAPLFVRKKIAEDILGPKADSGAGKGHVDPLKQPGLQANVSAFPVLVENPVSSLAERKPESPVYSSWMRRLQSLWDPH